MAGAPRRNSERRFVFNGASHLRQPPHVARRGSVRVLGLDPGLHLTGYGAVEAFGRTVRAVDAGVIRTDPGASLVDRLSELQAGLREVIGEWRPSAIALEDVFAHPAFPRTGILIGHVCGVICVAAAEFHIPVDTIPPAAVKRAMVASGRGGKRQIQRMVRVLLALDRDPVTHVGDALALALVALSRRGVSLVPAAGPPGRMSSPPTGPARRYA